MSLSQIVSCLKMLGFCTWLWLARGKAAQKFAFSRSAPWMHVGCIHFVTEEKARFNERLRGNNANLTLTAFNSAVANFAQEVANVPVEGIAAPVEVHQPCDLGSGFVRLSPSLEVRFVNHKIELCGGG